MVRALGAVWLLETLGELDLSGRLELEDALGRYEVVVDRGRLLRAVAQTGSLRVEGHSALEAVVTSSARGRFVRTEARDGSSDAPWIFDGLAEVTRGLSLEAARRATDAVDAPRALEIVDELARLYAPVATPRELHVLDGLRRTPASLEELATFTTTPPADVRRILGELLRRGVVREQN